MAVYLVEDDPSVRSAMEELARSHGHEVRGFDTAETFFDAPPPTPRDVVVLDAALPGMSGPSAAIRLRQSGAPPRIVMVSGLRGAAFERARASMQPDANFRKPLDAAAFVETLDRLSAGR